MSPKLLPLVSVFLFLAILLENKRRIRIKELVNIRVSYVWLLAFYITHLLALWNTHNFAFAGSDLGIKVSFLLFPVFFILKRDLVSLPKLMDWFVAGALVSVLIACWFAFSDYHASHDIRLSFQTHFVWSMHRGYWSSYLCIAYSWLAYGILNGNKKWYLYTPLLFMLSLGILFSASKAGIALLALSTIVLTAYAAVKTKKYGLAGFIVVVLFSLGYGVANKFPSITTRFMTMKDEFSHPKQLDITSTESNTARILMWRTATELIAENVIFGVGTGDIKDALKQRNIEKGYLGVAKENLNAHNQFLNTQLALGVLGSLALVGLFVVSLVFRPTENAFFIRWTLVIFLLSMLVESFLETQAGIMPFVFFLCIFENQKQATDV